jgi:phage FluMu protein Com
MVSWMLVLEAKLPCAICKKPGERRAIEGLPHNGILWRFIHDDGSEAHEWGRYKSFEDLAKHKDTNPAEMKCPRCKQHGTISAWREDPTNKPYKYRYTIKHYYNLESKFLSKQCHIYTQEQRDMVLKELGRYIAPVLRNHRLV